jgi:hypothetical protein
MFASSIAWVIAQIDQFFAHRRTLQRLSTFDDSELEDVRLTGWEQKDLAHRSEAP